jgi:hypothetical protein
MSGSPPSRTMPSIPTLPPTRGSRISAWHRATTTGRSASVATSSCYARPTAGTGARSCPCRTAGWCAFRTAVRRPCRRACGPRLPSETASCSNEGGPSHCPAGSGMCLATRTSPGSTRPSPMPGPDGCEATSGLTPHRRSTWSATCWRWAAQRRSWHSPPTRPVRWTIPRRLSGCGRRRWAPPA